MSEFHLKGNEHILDLGCGDGVLTSQLADLVPGGFVLGIDSSRGMIASAQKLQRGNLAFKLQDIASMGYQEEFDLIFSNATLHWVKDHKSILKNSFRGLKKGGIIRYNFAAEGNCSNFFKVVKSVMGLPEYLEYFKSFEWPWYMPSVEEYEKLAGQSPFREISVWGEVDDRYFPDKETLIRWIDQPSLVPFLEYIPEREKHDFRELVIEKMLERTLQVDGRCFETFRRINLYAKK